MHQILPAFVILSLSNPRILEDAGIYSYKRVDGMYKGVKEDSYLVIISETDKVFELVTLAYGDYQESILFVNQEREATLIPTNPDDPQQFLGKWTQYDGDINKLDAYTEDPTTGKVYICQQ